MAEEQQPDPIPLASRVILPYQTAIHGGVVSVRKFYDAMEAQLYANELAAHGIRYHLLNQNTNTLGPYSAFSQVELQVSEEDAPRARELLARLQLDPSEVEPEHEADPDVPVPDPAGTGMLVPAAAYDNPRFLYDAATALGAAHIESFLPTLVARGDRPAGTGTRFVIRVREADLERARTILQAEGDPEENTEPRCPRCGSWRVYRHPPKQGLVNFLLGRIPDQRPRLECLRCHHIWESEQSVGESS